MNRPTPNPSQEGNRHRSASCPFPSWEGLGVGSWSQCMRESERRLSMNRVQKREQAPALHTLSRGAWPATRFVAERLECVRLAGAFSFYRRQASSILCLMHTVWITGAGGLIGNYLLQTSARFAPDWNVIGLARDRLDLTDFAAVRGMFRQQPPRLIIHCAALSRSPACQENPALAGKLNVDATACLAELAADIPFILFSSDLVFDGRTGNYDENAQP